MAAMVFYVLKVDPFVGLYFNLTSSFGHTHRAFVIGYYLIFIMTSETVRYCILSHLYHDIRDRAHTRRGRLAYISDMFPAVHYVSMGVENRFHNSKYKVYKRYITGIS